jgi:uncharacterized membrane protein YccC
MALLVVALIFSVISSLVVASWMDRGIIVLSFFVIAVLFVELYVPYRLKKNQ